MSAPTTSSLASTDNGATSRTTLNTNFTNIVAYLDQTVLTTSDVAFASSTLSGLTASELVATNASKKLQSLAVATYPSLTEISYVKGVTSAIQTQMNLKAPLISPSFTTPSLGVAIATSVNSLSLTAVAIGFTIAGGTTSKTLTVPLDASVSGTNTGDNAANSSSTYIGTTAVALNRASAALTLAGITLSGATMTDLLTLATGTITIAPIKFVAGTNLTTPVAGVIEFDGTDFFISV